MSAARTAPLPPRLLRRAERLLRCDLSGVRLPADGHAARVGALALTRGAQIHVDPRALARPARELLFLLGHELAHVEQQRAGRVRPTRWLAGDPASDDARLEAEADAFGAALLGVRGRPPAHAAETRTRPVALVQRAVHVGALDLAPDPAAVLDERERQVLELIEGGPEWFEWALRAPQAFAFGDPEALLEGVQVGLHGRPYMLLPRTRLEVSPLKLLELSAPELRTLASYEQGGAAPRPKVREILARHRLRSQDALALGRRHLESVGVGEAPLFQTLGLDDAIELFELVDSLSGTTQTAHANQREAAAFAVSLGGSPREFVDYYRFYMAYLDRVARAREGAALPANGAARRAEAARALVRQLTPCVWDLLKCPWFDEPPRPEALPATLRQAIAGRPLGFGRASSAIYHTFAQAEPDAAEPDPAALVEAWRRDSTFFLHEARSATARLSQDGLSRSFLVESPSAVGRLELGPGGLLALEHFARTVRVH